MSPRDARKRFPAQAGPGSATERQPAASWRMKSARRGLLFNQKRVPRYTRLELPPHSSAAAAASAATSRAARAGAPRPAPDVSVVQ
jgi:hypothetical protein